MRVEVDLQLNQTKDLHRQFGELIRLTTVDKPKAEDIKKLRRLLGPNPTLLLPSAK